MSLTERRYEMQKCNDGKNIVIWDNKTGECLGFTAQIKGRLNLQNDIIEEQQATIYQQEQSIEILKQEIADTQAILEMLRDKLKGWNNE